MNKVQNPVLKKYQQDRCTVRAAHLSDPLSLLVSLSLLESLPPPRCRFDLELPASSLIFDSSFTGPPTRRWAHHREFGSLALDLPHSSTVLSELECTESCLL